jgi:signal transduction histidine kinase
MLETTEAKTTRLAQEAERRRIARELHDNAVQSLTALVTDMAYLRFSKLADNDGSMEHTMLSKLEAWHELAQESLFAIRQALSGLQSQEDQSFDLEAAVEALLTSLQHAGYLVTFASSSWPVSLPSGYASHLFYIIREALINISKHAHASTIIVSMSGFEDRLSISVSDDGIGIRSGAEETNGYHQGLTVLRERVALLDGKLSFANEGITGKGTRLEVEIPLPLKNSTSIDSYD